MKGFISQGCGFRWTSSLLVFLLLHLTHTAVAEEDGGAFRVGWNDGVRVKSQDERFEIKFGGRIFLDGAYVEADNTLDRIAPKLQGRGVEIRSARLYSEGTIYRAVRYKLEYDFEGGDLSAADVWIGLAIIPCVGHVRFGHMKEPYSLAALTDGNSITFMERALPAEAFAPSRNTGIQLSNSALDDRMTWSLGVFQATGESGNGFSDGSDYNVTVRMTGLPWYADEGRKLLHVGLSYSHQFRSRDAPVRFGSRPEAHFASRETVNTGDFDADDVDLLTPELALVFGPVSLQAEYFYVPIKRTGEKDLSYDGFYITVSYFVIGGQRRYEMREGVFGRVVPKENFRPTKSGWGAVELAGRISELDTNGPSMKGGKELNFTFGMNWYLNPNSRLMFNYIHASEDDRPDGANGDLNIVQARAQIDF